MSWYESVVVDSEEGEVHVYVKCQLTSLADVNEIIDMLVMAKNEAFPSGAEEHKRKMEAEKDELLWKAVEI